MNATAEQGFRKFWTATEEALARDGVSYLEDEDALKFVEVA